MINLVVLWLDMSKQDWRTPHLYYFLKPHLCRFSGWYDNETTVYMCQLHQPPQTNSMCQLAPIQAGIDKV